MRFGSNKNEKKLIESAPTRLDRTPFRFSGLSVGHFLSATFPFQHRPPKSGRYGAGIFPQINKTGWQP